MCLISSETLIKCLLKGLLESVPASPPPGACRAETEQRRPLCSSEQPLHSPPWKGRQAFSPVNEELFVKGLVFPDSTIRLLSLKTLPTGNCRARPSLGELASWQGRFLLLLLDSLVLYCLSHASALRGKNEEKLSSKHCPSYSSLNTKTRELQKPVRAQGSGNSG